MGKLLAASAIVGIQIAASTVQGYVPVYGGPTYSPQTGNGYIGMRMSLSCNLVGDGLAAGNAALYSNGTKIAERAWQITPNGPLELANLQGGGNSTNIDGVNANGTMVGFAAGSFINTNRKPVRWNFAGEVTELETLYDGKGEALAINSGGTIAGTSSAHAARWDAGGTAVTWLEDVPISTSAAVAINNAGTAVGTFLTAGSNLRFRAARWNAESTQLVQLEELPAGYGNEHGDSRSNAINGAGTAVGYAAQPITGLVERTLPIRWNAGGNAMTMLDTLPRRADGYVYGNAHDINEAGTVVGISSIHNGTTNFGYRAVRWNAGGTGITQLGDLGTDANGYTSSAARQINNLGIAVGDAHVYPGYIHATAWLPDSTAAIDLNSLIDPASGWTLVLCYGISETNWITGFGSFDPDGAGPLEAYDRQFLIQIPEPTSGALITIGFLSSSRRRRSTRHA